MRYSSIKSGSFSLIGRPLLAMTCINWELGTVAAGVSRDGRAKHVNSRPPGLVSLPFSAGAALEEIASLSRSQARGIVCNDSSLRLTNIRITDTRLMISHSTI